MEQWRGRLWLSDAAQVAAILGFLAPVVGYVSYATALYLVPGGLSPVLLQTRSLRGLAAEGALWLFFLGALSVAGVMHSAVGVVSHRLAADIEGKAEDLAAIEQERSSLEPMVQEVRAELAGNELSEEDRSAAEHLLDRWDNIGHRHRETMADYADASRRAQRLVEDPLDLRRSVLILVGTYAVAVWFVPWTAIAVGFLSALLNMATVHFQSRRHKPLRPRHMWFLVPVGLASAIALATFGRSVGHPVEAEIAPDMASATYSFLGRDDAFTYMQPCGMDDEPMVAVPTGDIRSMRFLPRDRSLPPTLPHMLAGEDVRLRPTVDCAAD